MRLFSCFLFVFLFQSSLFAAVGDTVNVQTFTFGSSQDSIFKFPDHSKTYRKVLMYYKLKCNSKQNPACGQWDYLTYTYLYRHTGKHDSTVKSIDTTYDTSGHVVNIDTSWNVKERLERFELARYITPYGINLSLGNGFTWVFDVSDYEPLLHDSVHLSAGNWQELLDMRFAFIEGTPSRQPYKVVNIWNGNFNYGDAKSIDANMGSKNMPVDAGAEEVKLKVRVTGHGFGGTDNCSEFCPRNHSIDINGTERWKQLVWRDNCGQNPVYPQGGTWVYDRANWCPGAEVTTYDAEITSYVIAGTAAKFDYHVEPYSWDGNGTHPYYAVEAQLIFYKKPGFNTDAGIEEIISPSKADMRSRINPVCAQPEIVVRNEGINPITSIKFSYGTKGGAQSQYLWQGSLDKQQATHILLPQPAYAAAGFPDFSASVIEVNGGADENPQNNVAYSQIPLTSSMPLKFVIWLRTNLKPDQNRYTVKDVNGNTLYSRDNMTANTLYKDTISLGNGCFTLNLQDDGGDGLSFFANSDGNGFFKLYSTSGKIIRTFNPDFGSGITFNFNAGWGLGVQNDAQLQERLMLFPNPATNKLAVDYSLIPFKKAMLRIYNLQGQMLVLKELVGENTNKGSNESESELDISDLAAGTYVVQMQTDKGIFTERLVVVKR